MTDLITPPRRPDFASVQLATDLQKLEEDWLALEHRSLRPHALGTLSDLGRTALMAQYRLQCAAIRRQLIDGVITFDVALVVHRILEAAFHFVRRALNGIPPAEECYHLEACS